MRRSVAVVAFVAAVAGPMAAYATIQLAPIMGTWRANLHVMNATLSSTRPEDTKQLRRAIQSYIDDATMVAGRLKGSGSQAQDFKHRFVALAAEGRQALGDVGHSSALNVDAARIKAACASCHAVYSN
jgi:hypothetical protein